MVSFLIDSEVFLLWPPLANVTIQVLFQRTRSGSEEFQVWLFSLQYRLSNLGAQTLHSFFSWPEYLRKLLLWELYRLWTCTFFPLKSWEFIKLWQWTCSMLGQLLGCFFFFCKCVHYRVSLWISTDFFFVVVFFLVVGFFLTRVTSNILFFKFLQILYNYEVHDCVLWHECCQNGHWWHLKACYFVPLPEK